MAIIADDIELRLSVPSASAGDAAVQADPNASLGKYMSTTVLAAGLNSLFGNITGEENAASASDYRCFFVVNTHATLTLMDAVVWITDPVGGADLKIAVDKVGPVLKGASVPQASVIISDTAPPANVGLFSAAPTSQATGLSLGELGPGQCRAVWVKRTATNSAAMSNDGVTIHVAGESPVA